MCCMGMTQFWSRRTKHPLLDLGPIDTQDKESDAHIPLLESNLMVFERSLHDQEVQRTDRIESWLDESFGCGLKLQKKQERDKTKLIAWKNLLSRQSGKSSLSDTPVESQFRNWLWCKQSSASGFSDFA